MRKQKHKKHSKNMKGPIIIIALCMAVVMYSGISMYFMNHFYFGSEINSIKVGGKTVKEADELISASIAKYTLELKERNDLKEEIKGSEIGLKYDPKDKINELKSSQKPFKWITSIFSKSHTELDHIVTFDEDLLREQIDNLSSLNSDNITEPKNASFEYTDKGYKVIEEVKGNKINKEALYDNITNAILKGETVIDLDEMNSYENPKYTLESKEVNDAKDMLDKYTNLEITYTFDDRKEFLDGSTINKWLYVNDNMEVTFDEKKVRSYVESLARKYNTFANTRNFTSSSGEIIQVSGGNYGWIIDKQAEVKELIETIKKGKNATREPVYSQTAVSRSVNDIGNTYVEIDFTKQHLWFYKNGTLFTEGDVVTGNMNNNWGTPAGTYRLNYKERNATLKGEDYSSPVNYWLPFNGNIGIHDATWRSEFGGQIYITNGSHGCVNAPYELAKKIFENIDAGTPIVCYY